MAKPIDKILKIPLIVRVGVLAAICVVIIVLFWLLSWVPKQKGIEVKEVEYNQLFDELNRLKAAAENLPALQEKVRMLQEERNKALKRLPTQTDITQLLRDLALLAEKSGVIIKSFQPKGETNQGLYAAMNIDLRLEGSYNELAVFFDRVGKLSRIVNISDIRLSNPREVEGQVSLSGECSATTFRFVSGAGG